MAYIIFFSAHDTYTFINQLYGEEFSFATGVAPRTDLPFLGNTSTNGPPESVQEITALCGVGWLVCFEKPELTNLWNWNVTI